MKERISKFRVKFTPEGCIRLTVWDDGGCIHSSAHWPTYRAAMDFLEATYELGGAK